MAWRFASGKLLRAKLQNLLETPGETQKHHVRTSHNLLCIERQSRIQVALCCKKCAYDARLTLMTSFWVFQRDPLKCVLGTSNS